MLPTIIRDRTKGRDANLTMYETRPQKHTVQSVIWGHESVASICHGPPPTLVFQANASTLGTTEGFPGKCRQDCRYSTSVYNMESQVQCRDGPVFQPCLVFCFCPSFSLVCLSSSSQKQAAKKILKDVPRLLTQSSLYIPQRLRLMHAVTDRHTKAQWHSSTQVKPCRWRGRCPTHRPNSCHVVSRRASLECPVVLLKMERKPTEKGRAYKCGTLVQRWLFVHAVQAEATASTVIAAACQTAARTPRAHEK